MRHLLGNVLRNTALVLVNVADRVDPQPVVTVHPFTVHTSSGTAAGEARIMWVGNFQDTA